MAVFTDPTAQAETDAIDFALVAWRHQQVWQVQELARHALGTVTEIAQELRRYPDADGPVALISVDEDFFILVRAREGELAVLLSDASAATDWPLARSACDHLGVVVDMGADDDDPAPAGDLGMVADLGMSAIDMGVLLDDLELYPDEQLSDIAAKLGFGPEFDDAVGLESE